MIGPSTRAVLRIGWRNIRRNKWRGVLIAVLIMLPVAAMSGGITLLATTTPTAEASATAQMGTADLMVYASSSDVTSTTLRAILPVGSRIEPLLQADARLSLPGRELAVLRRATDLEGLAHGMMTLIGGRLPENADEVAITKPLAEVAGLSIGDPLRLSGLPAATVVGYVEDPTYLSSRTVVQHVSLAESHPEASPTWLVDLPDGFPVGDLSAFGSAISISVRPVAGTTSGAANLSFVVLGALALVEAGLIAAAAFAVGIRRRQRELGLLTAVGAKRRQIAGTVVAEGLVLGAVGSAVGAIVGIGAVFALSPFLDELTNKRNQGVSVDLFALATACAIGLLAALLASAIPAWSAVRMPVLTALSGRRPPSSPAHRTLLLGGALVILAVAMTSTGATIRLEGSIRGDLSTFLLVGGAILGVFGFGATSPWLIERFELIGRLLPASPRIALRDTARARSRNAPIVTAMLAGLAATVSIAGYVASNDAANAARWQPWLRADQLIVNGEQAAQAGPLAAEAVGAMASAPVPWTAVVGDPNGWASAENRAAAKDTYDRDLAITLGDVQTLTVAGAESAAPALAAGQAVVLLKDPGSITKIWIKVFAQNTDGGEPTLVREVAIPAVSVRAPLGIELQNPRVVLSAQTAADLGLEAGPVDTYLIRLPHPTTEADEALAASAVSNYANTSAAAALGPTRPGDGIRIVLIVLSLLLAISVTAIGVALGEAESRPDQRTLLAIGADPRIRRRITAARAGVLALLAGLLAVPAGLLPAWGLLGTRDAPLVVPWPEIAAAVALLPIAAVVGALLLSRPIPAWSAFRDSGT